jgi:hypothetical protein
VKSDFPEDMDAQPPLLPFPPEGTPVGNISIGAMDAFNNVIDNTTLVQDINKLMAGQGKGCTVYVTGHSLGGCMATTVSL